MLFWLLYIVLPFHGELKFLNNTNASSQKTDYGWQSAYNTHVTLYV